MAKAVGVHVFAGGFTLGMQRAGFDVQCQLETHNFGLETTKAMCNVDSINDEDANWPDIDAEVAYGNPRCTAFSALTGGHDEDGHGPWAKQTCDAQQFAKYTAGKYDFCVWESVQQAYTAGKPLLDWMTNDIYKPKGYRVAHVFINAATFGNSQQRKRYFYCAYRDDRNFNIQPPRLRTLHYPVAYDALWSLRDNDTEPYDSRSDEYGFNSYKSYPDDVRDMMSRMPNGWGLKYMAQYAFEHLTDKLQDKWLTRSTDLVFSLHAMTRLNYLRPHPTLTSSAFRYIHPEHDRPITVGETATVMGWPTIPVGHAPVAQIAKGVVPDVAQWLGEQAMLYLNNEWGNEDWESSFNDKTGEWEGGDSDGKLEKVFDMTRYTGKLFDRSRYEVSDEVLFRHRHLVDRRAVERIRQKRGSI